MEELIRQIYQQAQLLGACEKFTGHEHNLKQLADLFLSPQGQEFCIKNRFPNLATFRQLKGICGEEELIKHGIYVDAGNIRMRNPYPRHVVLIGRTTATVTCDECQRYTVTIMHGAKAVINAMKWAVVDIESENRGNIICNVSDNAIIL